MATASTCVSAPASPALIGDGRVEAVELTDGERVPADVVVVGLGALPNIGVAGRQRTRADPGLACDATLTSADDPDILGAGDIVAWPHPLADGEPIRIEHWTVAAEQGQHAGRNVLVAPGSAQAVLTPRPISGQTNTTRRSSRSACPDEPSGSSCSSRTPDRWRRVYGGERDGRLVGVIAINGARRLGPYRMALEDPPVFDELRATVAADPAALAAPVGAA